MPSEKKLKSLHQKRDIALVKLQSQEDFVKGFEDDDRCIYQIKVILWLNYLMNSMIFTHKS